MFKRSDELVDAILKATPGLLVRDIVSPGVMQVLPNKLRARFGNMTIKWRNDREIWGLSFTRHEKSIMLGHFRGHHIATHPEMVGFTAEIAAAVLLREVEGVLLHELGHFIYACAVDSGEKKLALAWGLALEDGWASQYGTTAEEGAAEAFRWWVMSPADYSAVAPQQHLLLVSMIRTAESSL